MTATVAIIGRPNVGKSTLFNRLVGKKLALVDDLPGVTRDRREGEASLGHLRFNIVDTAGLEEADPGSLAGRMRAQTQTAIDQADVILFMIDARLGLTPMDQPFADLVRKSGKPVILLANKAEGRKGLDGIFESYALGLGDPVPFSAEHGEGTSDLLEALTPYVDVEPEEEEPFDESYGDKNWVEAPAAFVDEDAEYNDPNKPLRVTIIGRPNAGKSTLVNRMLGEERLLVGPEAGITRDTISVDYEWRGRPVKLFDTAGMRKRARIEEKVEKMSVQDALRAIRFAEVVVVLLDATIPFEKQDLTLVDFTEREGRTVVIGLNKWDLVADKNGLLAELKEKAKHVLAQVRGVPIVPLSGLAGEGIDRLMQAVFESYEVWNRRISTAKINRWLEGVLSAHPPPAVAGRRIKIRYMTQAKARSPTFALFGNQLDHLPVSYTRYLVNNLREAFELPGTPIRLHTRGGENPYDKNKRAG
ncbi:ribosome biogenesis GTPase Der [soil metagenome]